MRALFLLPIAICLHLSAQESPDHTRSWELGIETGLEQVKEENLHGKGHRGLSTGIRYAWNSIGKQHQSLEAGVQYGRPKTAFESLAATVHAKIDLRYGWTYSTFRSDAWVMRTGPFVQLAYDLNYYPNWDDSHLYWSDHFDLGLRHQASKDLGSGTITARGNLAVLSVVWRPDSDRPYKIDDLSGGGILRNLHSNSAVGSLNRCVDLNVGLTYRFRISERLAQKIRYTYQYRRVAGPTAEPFQSAGHWLGLQWEVL